MKKQQKMKRYKVLMGCILIGMALLVGVLPIKAEEKAKLESTQNDIQGFYTTVKQDSHLYEKPDEQSAVIAKIASGSNLYILGEDDGGWHQAICNGQTGYVKTADLKETEPSKELAQEMAKHFEEEKIQIEEFERERKNRRNTQIWGSVIVILILVIFGFNIRTVLQKNKKEKTNEASE